jgi:uncharacterized membrane protein
MTTAPSPAHGPARPLSPALDKTFKVGLVLKGLDGVLEVAGGLLLLLLTPQAIEHVVRVLTAHELSEDPHDVVARYLLHTASHLNHGTTLFGAIYLLSHGAAKIVLVALVLKDKLWAYPWLIGLLLAFIAYQLYQIIVVKFSAGLTALTVFDAALVWLTWREYRSKRARAHPPAAPVPAASPAPPGALRPRARSVPDGRARSLPDGPARSLPDGPARSAPDGQAPPAPDGRARPGGTAPGQ